MVYDDVVSVLDVAENEDGEKKIIQYVLRGVYLERSSGVTIDSDGEKRAYSCTLFVPKPFQCEDEYVEPRVWERLSFEDKCSHFTFRPRQVIVATDQPLSYDTLDAVLNGEIVTYTAIGVDYFDKVLPHFEVLGK